MLPPSCAVELLASTSIKSEATRSVTPSISNCLVSAATWVMSTPSGDKKQVNFANCVTGVDVGVVLVVGVVVVVAVVLVVGVVLVVADVVALDVTVVLVGVVLVVGVGVAVVVVSTAHTAPTLTPSITTTI